MMKLILPLVLSYLVYATNPATFEITSTLILTYSVTISTPTDGLVFMKSSSHSLKDKTIQVKGGDEYIKKTCLSIKTVGGLID